MTDTGDKITPIRDKTKTQAAVTAPPVQENCHDDRLDDAASPMTAFKISKRNYRVFSMLFRLPHEEGVPGKLPWIHFLHAMSTIGSAIQKLDRSPCFFSLILENLDRSIMFSRAASRREKSFLKRGYGRCLTGAFGWAAETFY